jgi:hypothetical protein
VGDRRKYVTRREQKLLVVRPAKVSIEKTGDDALPANKRRVALKSQIPSSIVATEVAPANKKSTPAQISGEQSF